MGDQKRLSAFKRHFDQFFNSAAAIKRYGTMVAGFTTPSSR
ncbi:hypothetical protein AVDCRST_MAG94-3707 [uncultured Leptolyngbya sp.]|uniref:Uncharacterized protein n=1 Tax=uncultured Leptolyngbya sp. TaxID=332963 RepID=A0A6J4MQ57_9CYAN|nr:hypothetical protein AVDCRST_MAG94-3707 [uncultured Leptolyngbya sp.]